MDLKPMLAIAAPADLKFPLYASNKLDGIRCLIKDGVAYTRKLEVIPNRWVQAQFGHSCLNGLDGELIVGPPYADDVFNRTQSGVMSYEGVPNVMFYVFDYWNGQQGEGFQTRFKKLTDAFAEPLYAGHPAMELLDQELVHDMDQLTRKQELALECGYEGLILRSVDGPYKFGRSTAKQGWMMKLKRFETGEARIVGFKELMVNNNDLESDALGHAKRSSSKEGLVPGGVLGSMVVHDCETGVEFGVGSGFDSLQRLEFWDRRNELLGKIVRYKHFEVGVKTAPRFPVFLGFRDERDMGEPK